jgi:heavy metal sensor kinase
MTLPFRTRLVLFCTVTFALLLTVMSAVSYRLLRRQLNSDADADLVELTTGLHGYLKLDGGKPAIAFDGSDAEQVAFVQEATRYYQIYDAADGQLLVESQGLEPLGVHFTPDEVRGFVEAPKAFDIQTAYGRFRFSNTVMSPASGRRYLVQVGASLDPVDAALRRFLDVLLWSALPSLLVAVVAVWWTVRTAVAPLGALARETRRITIGTLDRRLPTRGTADELDEVAAAFNDTLSRLETAVAEMRQFSSALAHEVRTPLAALRGEIELSLMHPAGNPDKRASAWSQIEEIDKLTRLVNQLLTLARAESGEIPLNRQHVDLGALAVSVTEQLEPVACAQHLSLGCVVHNAVKVPGDAGWLERLLLNLLDNALKYTPHGGAIDVSVDGVGGYGRVDVRDTGIGISHDVLPKVFERFYRADPSRSSAVEGAGLGLSLAKWIIDRHDGRIEVESTPGRGSTFTVWLPASAVPRTKVS